MKYIVFCKPSCPYCIKAVDLLKNSNKSFKVVNFNEDQKEVLQEIKDALDWQTVPMVFLKEKSTMSFVGGYTDLVEQLENA